MAHDEAAQDETGPAAYDAACEADDGYQACLRLVAERAGLRATDVVADVGCGTGNFALAMAPLVARVEARDDDPDWLDAARRKARGRGVLNVAFADGSVTDPCLPAPADVVVAPFALHHALATDDDALGTILGALAPVASRTLVFPDYFAPDGVHETPPVSLPRLDEGLADVGFALAGIEWCTDAVGVAFADRVKAQSAR